MNRSTVDIWSGTYAEFCNERFKDYHVHVYILYERLESGALRLYIGETTNEKRRIRQSLNRFSCNGSVRVVLLLFSDNLKEKTCRTHIEGRLYFALRRHPQIGLLNHHRMVSASQCGIASEFQTIADRSVRLVMLHLAELGFHIVVPDISNNQKPDHNFEMLVSHQGHIEYADAYHDQGQWIVRKGSAVRGSSKGPNDDARRLRRQLIEDGLLEPVSDGLYRFKVDVAFSHANISASVINGKTACGNLRWLVRGHGMPLRNTCLDLRARKGEMASYEVRINNTDSL